MIFLHLNGVLYLPTIV